MGKLNKERSTVNRSIVLLGYDSKNGIPNGDPYTGEPRFDVVTNRKPHKYGNTKSENE